MTVIGHQPSGRLGKEEDKDDDDTRERHLEPQGDAPCHAVGQALVGSVGDPGGRNSYFQLELLLVINLDIIAGTNIQ